MSAMTSRHAPSRYHLALFRVAAWVRLEIRGPETQELPRLLAFQPGQSAVEVYATTLVYNLTMTALFAGSLTFLIPPASGWFVLCALATLPAAYVFQLGMMSLTSLLLRPFKPAHQRRLRIQAAVFQLALTLAAVAAAVQEHWIRWPAWTWLGLIALNAAAAGLELMFRSRIAEIERRYGRGASSEKAF